MFVREYGFSLKSPKAPGGYNAGNVVLVFLSQRFGRCANQICFGTDDIPANGRDKETGNIKI